MSQHTMSNHVTYNIKFYHTISYHIILPHGLQCYIISGSFAMLESPGSADDCDLGYFCRG